MQSKSTDIGLVIGLAAFGLGLVVAGVRKYRLSRVEGGEGTVDEEVEAEEVAGDREPILAGDLPEEREAPKRMPSNASQDQLPITYFLLVFVLAVPFWLFGGEKLPLQFNLPVSALATFVPMTAGLILAYRQHGSNGVKDLLKKALDYRKIKNKIWYLPILLLMPLIAVLSYTVLRLTGSPIPDPIQIPLLMVPAFFVLFFIGDTGEELGWMGYAIDPMQKRWGALRAGLVLGVVWVSWHFIPWVQTGNPLNWIVWQGLFSVALRILIVWIYNNTGKSVFATILFHDMSNIGWSLFPNYGSHYNPFVTSIIAWLAVAIVTFIWRPMTLARYRHASDNILSNQAR